MSPCIPRFPTPQCGRCLRFAPRFVLHRRRQRVVRIDASALHTKGVCLMLVQRGLP
jgi:hypothetical protein